MASIELNPTRTTRLTYPLARLGMRLLVRLLAPRWRVTGRHNIPYHGAVIFAPNHISDADPAMMYVSVRRALWYMAKSELFEEWPVLVPIMRYAQTFPVEQESADRAALHFAEQLLQRGQGLVIFPEGHCSPTGEMQPLQPGAALLALRTGVPVVPVGIWGSNQIIHYGRFLPQPTLAPVHVHFGTPLRFSNLAQMSRRAQREAATQQLETSIRHAAAIARSRAQAATCGE